jgi:hypothetical protein
MGASRRRIGIWAASTVIAMCALPAQAALASTQSLANSLQSDPVQTIGVPKSSFTSLSRSQINSLKAEIASRDPGRIWILVVSPRTQTALGNLADPVFSVMPAGTLLAVAEDRAQPNTSNWWVGSSWESSDLAESELNSVIQGYKKGQGSFFGDLQLEIGSFAYRDAANGHPALGAGADAGGGGDSGGGGGGGGGIGAALGLILGLGLPFVLVVLPFLIFGEQRWRRSRQKSQEAEDKQVDARAKAQTDLVKLGSEITRLDIDSSLANANPQGKDEYRHALGCYEAGEKRLKDADDHPDDDYRFKKAQWAIEAGLKHVEAADKLFNPSRNPAKDVDDLAKLAALHQSGALTDAEFAAQKAKLIQ